jgi:signal peptidase I
VNRTRLRSALLTAVILITAGAGWFFLAPPSMGGSTTYVVTSGVSMEPRFHTGDLALVQPAANYKVGEIVAYRSSLLHVSVLHRIIAIHDGHYTFKGDHNSFTDPAHPTRAQLIGKLWVRIAHGGVVVRWLHTPVMVALSIGGAALLLLLGSGEQRRRRNRRGRANRPGRQGLSPVKPSNPDARLALDFRPYLVAAAVAAVVFLAIGLVAFTRPVNKPAIHKIPYTQQVKFGYHAGAPVGPVYPTGTITTGDPVFLQLVHRLDVQIDYRLMSDALHVIHGTDQAVVKLSGPTGWSRTIPLGPIRHFAGDHVRTRVALDLTALQGLVGQVQRLTGVTGSGYTIAIATNVHVRGLVADQPINTNFSPQLPFQLEPLQLQPGGGSSASGATPATSGFAPIQKANVTTAASVSNALGVAGAGVAIGTLRVIGPAGFLIALASTLLLAALYVRSQAFAESARIQAQYGHLIVPITAGADLGWPPVDVTSIKALVRLAEVSGQLILHNHDETHDTYLVNDEGTVYRYQVELPKVVWGEWTAPAVEVAAAAAEVAAAAEAAAAAAESAT